MVQRSPIWAWHFPTIRPQGVSSSSVKGFSHAIWMRPRDTRFPLRPGRCLWESPACRHRHRLVRGTAFRLPKSRRLRKGARVELLDPAGRVTDRQVVARDGRFALSCTARASGLATFSLVLRGRNGKLVEDAALPLMVVDATKPNLLILTGAPGPEVKYPRRWATDAGFSVNAQIRAGGGVALGDPPIFLSSVTLQKFDDRRPAGMHCWARYAAAWLCHCGRMRMSKAAPSGAAWGLRFAAAVVCGQWRWPTPGLVQRRPLRSSAPVRA